MLVGVLGTRSIYNKDVVAIGKLIEEKETPTDGAVNTELVASVSEGIICRGATVIYRLIDGTEVNLDEGVQLSPDEDQL
jgi:hypothetical protein